MKRKRGDALLRAVKRGVKRFRARLTDTLKFERMLSVKNLRRKPLRTGALVLLSALLACSLFGGSVVVLSLRRGLNSYESRLGADIVVVPNEAASHGTLETILLQGIPGYFYTDASCLEKIRATEGVEAATPQFFLSSASAGCCSMEVQIIGFDPETDFSIQPWIGDRYPGSLRDGELIVGSEIMVPRSRELKFYNTSCRVAAQLDPTGTGLDNAVYANMHTVKAMVRCAQELGFHAFDNANPDSTVSSVMVRVKNGYSIEGVTSDINSHIRRVRASQTRSMISSIAEGLGGVSRVIGFLTGMIWLLSTVILILAFAMISNERKREFAILRVMGASRRTLSWMLFVESGLTSFSGAAIGIFIAAVLLLPFRSMMRHALDRDYLPAVCGRGGPVRRRRFPHFRRHRLAHRTERHQPDSAGGCLKMRDITCKERRCSVC